MITLHFDHEAIEALLLHSHESVLRAISPNSQADEQICLKGIGTREQIPAGLHLVKQHGIFLQSNGITCCSPPCCMQETAIRASTLVSTGREVILQL